MSEPSGPCLHVTPQQDLPFRNKELFTKKSFKTYNSNGLPTKHDLTADNCPLCFAYGFRRGALEIMGRTDPAGSLTPLEHVNPEQFKHGNEKGGYYATLPLTHPGTPGPEKANIVFPIHKGENGEQYHAIICSFLSDCKSEAIKLHTDDSEGPASQAQRDLLRYYLPSETIVRKGKSTNKKSATDYIANVFQKLDTPDKQAERYEDIREFLDDGGFQPQPGGNHYISPSYTAKYWLNRYLVLTGQGKLPKSGPNAPDTKIAIIMIRISPTAADPRLMTDNHLKKCINAIQAANKVAAKRQSGKPITHVLLYGDKTPDEMESFKAQIEGEEGVPNILYLTSPFNKDGDEHVKQFWDNFLCAKDTFFSKVPETVPVEAKILSIFVALKKRYGNKICTIGFRSGTLDGAGFVGIPIFFLDDVSSYGKWPNLKDMRYIWDGDSQGAKDGERMAYAGQMMNTFVRVNVKDEYENTRIGRVVKAVVKASNDEWKHLGSALYTYMFHETELNGGDELLWLKRVSMMKGPEKGTLETRFNAFVAESKGMRFMGKEMVQTVPNGCTGLVKVQTADWASTHEKSWPMRDVNSNGEGFLVKVTPRAINTPTLDLMTLISYFFFLFIFVFFCVLIFS